MSLHLRNAGALDGYLLLGRTHLKCHVGARFLSDAQNHTLRFELLETLGRYGHIHRSRRQSRLEIVAAIVRGHGVVNAAIRAADPHLRAFDSGAAGIGDGAGDGCGVLSEEARGDDHDE